MNDLLAELLRRLNGEEYEKHDNKIIFAVNYFETWSDGTAKLVVKPVDNPDYDPQYWQKKEAEQKAKEGAANDSNK
jgi:hypothetical protein